VSGNDLPVRINPLRLNTLVAFENCVTVTAGETIGGDSSRLPYGEARAIVLLDPSKK
jgi:hypothetical protein